MARTVRIVEVGSVVQAWKEAKQTVCTLIKDVRAAQREAAEIVKKECGQDMCLKYKMGDLEIDSWRVWWYGKTVPPDPMEHFRHTLTQIRELAKALAPLASAEAWVRMWAEHHGD